MVLLADGEPPDPGGVVRTLREHWEAAPPILDLETKEGASVAAIPGGSIGLLHVPMPVPPTDLEGPVNVAWHWPEARHLVPTHKSHVICFAGSTELSRLDLRLLHTKLVAAVVDNADAVAVYVGDAMLVRKAAEYGAEGREATSDSLPLLLWVGFNPVKTGVGHSAYTTGLTSFDLLELEVHDSTLPWADLMGRLADIAHYELTAGLQIGDGETVGSSEEERIRIRHGRSSFIPEGTAAIVEF